jgi:hypothetical protein
VTFSPETLATLEDLSARLGRPKAALVSELVDQTLPALLTTLEALRVIQEQPREAQRLVQEFAADSVAKLGQAQLDLDSAIDKRTLRGRRRKAAS